MRDDDAGMRLKTGGLRILHATEAPSGGVLSYLQELVACQVTDDSIGTIDIVTPDINRPALERLAHPKLTIHAFEHSRGSVTGLLHLARTTARVVRQVRPHVAHIHSTFAGAVLRPVLPLVSPRLPVVYCAHGWAFSRGSKSGKNSAIGLVERLLALATSRIVCISEFERREALRVGISADRCLVIHNGIARTPLDENVSVLSPRDAGGRRRVLFVGRFDRQKGFDIFLDVMQRLGDAATGTAVGSFIVSRDGDLEIPANVQVLDWLSRADLEAVYRTADLLIVPSRWEGFGLVAVEAMRARLPVFASRTGGLQEVVVDGETGRLFDLESPAQIAGMIAGITDKELMRYGEAGHTRFHQLFTADRMSAQITALYTALAARSPAGP